MKSSALKLVVDNQPRKPKGEDLMKQSRKMACRNFRQTLRSTRGKEEYLNEII